MGNVRANGCKLPLLHYCYLFMIVVICVLFFIFVAFNGTMKGHILYHDILRQKCGLW